MIERLPAPAVRIRWETEVGMQYQVWFTSDLYLGGWVVLGPKMGGTGEMLHVDDNAEGIIRRFYRVESISP